jgi:hypothetical protein
MRLSLPEASIEIREFSRRLAPAGEIEFPATGLHVAPSSALWNGAVIYGRNHRFPIWGVEVRIRQRWRFATSSAISLWRRKLFNLKLGSGLLASLGAPDRLRKSLVNGRAFPFAPVRKFSSAI